MKSLILLFLLSFSFMVTMGQQPEVAASPNISSEIALVFNQDEFEGRFTVQALSDGDYDYYVVDLTRFATRLEKIYFLNLAYAEQKIISIDHAIDKDQIWFKAYHQYQETEITCLFGDLETETTKACSSMTPEEQGSWLKKFDTVEK